MEAGILLYDIFICHASEDKDAVVRPLAFQLREQHLEVWYDEFSLEVGDSLRRSIDRGLARSRLAVVVLSPHFFQKQWPQRELDGLVARQMHKGERVILPVWHGVGYEEVLHHSPPLADTLAANSAEGLDAVVAKLVRAARPRPSPLVIARDELQARGLRPPTITDEWWLDIVEASHREPNWGFAMHREHWGRWSFPLPPDGTSPEERGDRLAWVAMQLVWTKEADLRRISQITPPEAVLAFIREHEGLAEVSSEFPQIVAAYAPQLLIPGFSGEFEEIFDELLNASMAEAKRKTSGSGLTVNGEPPHCDIHVAFRHPTFGNYRPASVACQFVQGDIGGPSPRLYEQIDYIAWALSDASYWMPPSCRDCLLQGLKEWAAWSWYGKPKRVEIELGLDPYDSYGRLFWWLVNPRSRSNRPRGEARDDLERRLGVACHLLQLPEGPEPLVDRFLKAGFIETYREINSQRR